MHPRYQNKKVTEIFSDENKLKLWQKVELAVIEAKANLGFIPKNIFAQIKEVLESNPIDIAWWKARDKEIGHDLNAFLDERLRFIPQEFHQYFHERMTSYDTEESPFILNLSESIEEVQEMASTLIKTMDNLALRHRYTVMLARTHGQGAELQSFGKRVLAWNKDFCESLDSMSVTTEVLEFSTLSGAIGNFGGISIEVVKEALGILGFEMYYGDTQIMPRVLYAPIAQGLCNMVMVLHKIANDIRLSARSGLPLLQEPFGKNQKGSSAMPQKKNPISLEQIEGLARMAKGYMLMLTDNIFTWEERAIEQSCVERVAWPDLFHITLRALTVMNNTLSGLRVFSDNMLQEVIETRGTYASGEAKEFLKKHLSPQGKTYEDIYRLVQVACFNVFELDQKRLAIRECIPSSFQEAEKCLDDMKNIGFEQAKDINKIICQAELRPTSQLDVSVEKINEYNTCLEKLFENMKIRQEWRDIFKPEHLLKNEEILFDAMLELNN